MQKNYELLYIVHPDLEGSIDKVTEKVRGFVTKQGGEILNEEDWGKRKLAYKIAKNDFGVYVLVNFALESTKLAEVERDLRLSEEIMRSMIVIMPEVSEEEAEKPKKAAKKAVKKEEPASIIVAEEVVEEVKEEKPAKKTTKKAEKEEAEVAEEVKEEKPAKKTTKKAAKTEEVDEAERLKKLDEKLDELLK